MAQDQPLNGKIKKIVYLMLEKTDNSLAVKTVVVSKTDYAEWVRVSP